MFIATERINGAEMTPTKGTKVSKDKKTGAQSIATEFVGPTGSKMILVIIKLNTIPWKPDEEIENIKVNFK